MQNRDHTSIRVLALYPSASGFGYAVFEGPKEPIAFEIKRINEDKNKQAMRDVKTLIEAYKPDVVVLEDYTGEGSRKTKRVQYLIESIVGFAHMKGITTRCYSRAMIRGAFAEFGASTKQEIAETIAGEFPEFEPRLPAKRKVYLPEDPRMSIFDATALALTYYVFEEKKKRAA